MTKKFAYVWLLAKDGSARRNISGWLPEALKVTALNDAQSVTTLGGTNNPMV